MANLPCGLAASLNTGHTEFPLAHHWVLLPLSMALVVAAERRRSAPRSRRCGCWWRRARSCCRADADEPLRVRGLGRQERRLKRLRCSSGGQLQLAGGGVATSLRISSKDPHGIWLGTRRYRGDLRLLVLTAESWPSTSWASRLTCWHVVGSEMPSSGLWPLFEPRPLCRLCPAPTHSGKGDFDVRAGEQQVYKGLSRRLRHP